MRRRQGPDGTAVTLKRRRIYILPTRYGLVFACLLFAMLLGSMNYGASLGFALTFLLTGVGLVTLHHCHANLLGVEIRFAGAPPVFAGQDAVFRVALANGSGADRYELALASAGRDGEPVDLEAGRSAVLSLAVPTSRRGWVALPRFSVATRHPANLCRAWTYVHMDARCLVYPQPAPPGQSAPPGTDDGGGRIATDHADSDFAGLRSALPGDPPRRIAWKAYARTEQLLLKQFAGGERLPTMFEWDALPGIDTEPRLSQLARWCLDAAAGGERFGLRLPSKTVPLDSGDAHLHRCLAALALFDGRDGGRDGAGPGLPGSSAQRQADKAVD